MFFSPSVAILLAAAETRSEPMKRSALVRRATFIADVYLDQVQDEAVTNAAVDKLLLDGLLGRVDQDYGIGLHGVQALEELKCISTKLGGAITQVLE